MTTHDLIALVKCFVCCCQDCASVGAALVFACRSFHQHVRTKLPNNTNTTQGIVCGGVERGARKGG